MNRRPAQGMAKKPSLYDVLGVKPDASKREIDAAYAALKEKHEALRDQGGAADSNQLLFLQDAHSILSTSVKREEYDNKLAGNPEKRASLLRVDMNSEQLESGKKLFYVLLGVDIAVTALNGLNAFSTVGTLKDIESGTRAVDQSLLSSWENWKWFSRLMFLTWIGVGLGLVKWLNSCYRFAKDSLGATGFKNESWTAIGWIIPIFNLFKPYQIINEIYKAGAPAYTASGDWKKENSSGLLLTWWIFWAVTHFIGAWIGKQLLRGSTRGDVTLQQAIDGTELQAWACVTSIIIAGLWFVVANYLTMRLLQRAQVFKQADGAIEQPSAPNSGARNLAELSMSEAMRISAAPSTFAVPAATPLQPAAQVAEADAREASVAAEQFWSAALAEYDSSSRRPGLWARAFAEAQGNEAVAKANYLRYRADELQKEHGAHLERKRRDAEAAAERKRRDATLTFADGRKYVGEFKDNKMSGRGT